MNMGNTTFIGLILLGVIAFGIGFRMNNKSSSAADAHQAHGCCACSHASHQSHGGAGEVESDIKNYPFASNGSLSIDNTNGSIVIEKHDANTLIIESVKKARAEHLADIEIVISVDNGVCAIETLYKKPKISGSVDYVIKAPAGTIVHASTVNGSIATHGIHHVNADAVNGSIMSHGVEQVQMETVSGELSAAFSGAVAQSSLQSVNGTIHVSLPASYDGSVDIRSPLNGAVRSDFPLSSEHAAIHLETVNGSIAVTRSK